MTAWGLALVKVYTGHSPDMLKADLRVAWTAQGSASRPE